MTAVVKYTQALWRSLFDFQAESLRRQLNVLFMSFSEDYDEVYLSCGHAFCLQYATLHIVKNN